MNQEAGLSLPAAWKLNAQTQAIASRLTRNLGTAVATADAFCANLECVLSARGEALDGKKYTLRAAPHYLQALKGIGLTHACLANNHILDFGPDALADTCRYLERSSIAALGLNHGSNDHQEPVMLERDGTRVALLNYVEPGIIDPAPEAFLRFDPCPFVLDIDTLSNITCPADECLHRECLYYDDCFVMRVRQRAAEARVVITNHHLLITDLQLRAIGGVSLPDTDLIVCDEAHQLEDVATSIFETTVTDYTVTSLMLRRMDAGRPLHLILCNPDLIYPVGPGQFGFTAGGLAAMLEAVLRERYPSEAKGFIRSGKPHRPSDGRPLLLGITKEAEG